MTSPNAVRNSQETNSAQRSTGWICAAFLTSALVCIAFFLIPTFIIRPFRYEAPRALWLAMFLRQRAPIGTLIAAALCVVLALVVWKTLRLWGKALLVFVLLPVAFCVVMARLNYFEWMFHPIDHAQFLPQAETKLDAKEMIMAVRFNGDARAYPISQMAYHHILNDVVGGVPIAVTY